MSNDDSLERLTSLAKKQLKLETDIIECEKSLEKLKADLRKVQCDDIPALMDEYNIPNITITLEDGTEKEINIKRDIRAYVLEQDKNIVYAWLRENNQGGIIKAKIEASFGNNEIERAMELYKNLIKEGFVVNKKEDIHWMTFNKFVKECQEEGILLHDKIQIQPLVEARIK